MATQHGRQSCSRRTSIFVLRQTEKRIKTTESYVNESRGGRKAEKNKAMSDVLGVCVNVAIRRVLYLSMKNKAVLNMHYNGTPLTPGLTENQAIMYSRQAQSMFWHTYVAVIFGGRKRHKKWV